MSQTIKKNDLGYLGQDFQYRLIHTLLDDKEFFKDLQEIINQNMFTDTNLKTIVGVMKDYYEKKEAVPNYDILKIILNDKSHSDIERETYMAVLDKILSTDTEGVEYIKELSEKFFKQQNFIRIANEILRISGDGDISKYERCVDLLSEALTKGTHQELGDSVFNDLGDTLSDDYRITIPTGIGKIDEALEGGIAKGELGLIGGSSGFGKAQPLTSHVLTPNGFKLMGDMQVGDKVIGADGQVHNVSGVFPQAGLRPIYKVTLSNGSSCECDFKHLWSVIYEDGSNETVELSTLINLYKKKKCYIPSYEEWDIERRDIDIVPLEIGKKIDDIDEIPEILIYNAVDVRLELIQSIIEVKNNILEFKSEKIANQVAVLLRSFGEVVEIGKKGSKYCLYPLHDEESYLYITDIQYVRDDKAQCIMVDSEEHLYITDGYIVTHNTSMTTALANHAATYKCQQNNYQGFKVLQIVFEDRIKQIQRKHLSRITGIEARNLSKPEYIDEVRKKIEEYEDRELLDKNLRIVRFPSGEITAQYIKNYIKRLANNGFMPDLVIVDYFECLDHEQSSSNSNEYSDEGKTMRKFESMVGDLNIACWIPSQGTKDSVNVELMTMDKISGSAKKFQIAHIVMTIARTVEDIEANKATIAILKNRAGKSGKVLNNVDFNNGTCTISTDSIDEFDNMLAYKQSKQKEELELQREIFKKIKSSKT